MTGEGERIRLINGDCLKILRAMPDNSIDSAVIDPPYGLGKVPDPRVLLRQWLDGEEYAAKGGGFMGQKWDAFVPGPRLWSELARVLKPGAHAVIFAGQRTADVMGIALRLGGFEIRDLGAWQTWQGFPKSLDVGDGRGTALKPCLEPWILARVPFAGTVADNVKRWGTGAINIDACRYGYGDPAWPGPGDEQAARSNASGDRGHCESRSRRSDFALTAGSFDPGGRWPANVYACPKPSTAEREAGCEGLKKAPTDITGRKPGSAGQNHARAGMTGNRMRGNAHPTVKPIQLIRWLQRLVTPRDGVTLDTHCGSGTSLIAAHLEGLRAIGCELSPDYCTIARARLEHWTRQGVLDLW